MIRLTVPCSLEYRDVALRAVAAACRIVRPRRMTDPHPEDADFEDQVVTAFGEAFTNAVVHSAAADPPDLEIEVETHPDRLTIRLLDHGEPFELVSVTPPDLDRLPESGLGVHIMRSWMDEVTYRRGSAGPPPVANVLSMTRRLGDFSRTDDGDATVLRVAGVLDAVTVPNIRRTIDALVAERRRSITVDLSALRLIDSSGVAIVVSLYKRCKEFGGTVRVTGLRDQPRSIFKLLRLDHVFDLP